MSWQPTTATRKLLTLAESNNRFKAIYGSTGAGKTYNILPILLDYAIKHPGLEISVVSETIPHLKKGAMKDFIKIARSLGRWNDRYWSKMDRIYQLPNNSYIEFFSADDGEKLKGPRRDILYINEVDRIGLEAFNQLNVRTNYEVWVDFNPIGHFWAYDELLPRENCDVLKLTYKDNECVADSVVDEIMYAKKRAEQGSRYWSNWYRVYGLGEKGQLEGACITEFDLIDELPRNDEGRIEARLLCIGVDFGYTNDPSAAVALWKYNDQFIVDEVLYSTKLMNNEIADLIKQYLERHDQDIECEIYVDNAEPKSRDELIGYGLPNVYSCTNKYIVQGLNLINQQSNLITKRSENLLREISLYIYEKDKDGNVMNKPRDKHNHAPDAWRYGLTSYLDNPTSGEYHIY